MTTHYKLWDECAITLKLVSFFSVKPAVFDLVMTTMIVLYMGLIYIVIKVSLLIYHERPPYEFRYFRLKLPNTFIL